MFLKPKVTAICFFALLITSCLPQHLQKYRQSSNSENTTTATTQGTSAIPADIDTTPPIATKPTVAVPDSQASSTTRPTSVATAPVVKTTIYSVDSSTFRFNLSERDVWDSAINVLIRNYNINIVQKDSGIITTEWDTVYLNDGIFRNKVSMRVQRVSLGAVDVIVHNSVEKLQDASAAGTVGGIWLPAKDKTDEVGRIIKNMAIVLNQPPPLINSRVADSGESTVR